MSDQLYTFPIYFPGAKGINRRAPISSTDLGWAVQSINTIVDEAGRAAARKGWVDATAAPISGTPNVVQLHEYVDSTGATTIIAATDTKLFSGAVSGNTVTLTDRTGALTPTTGNWQFQNFNGKVVGFQSGSTPIVWAGSGNFAAIVAGSGTLPTGDAVLSAFGRLWAQKSPTVRDTLQYSDLLIETAWGAGSAGSIDLRTVWRDGADEIIALAEFANRLVIFGKRNILVYSGASSPSTMALEEAIGGVGCYARDSVVNIGDDLIFLSAQGVQSLRRIISQKNLPLIDLSKNARDMVLTFLGAESPERIRAAYSQKEGCYLIAFPSASATLYMDTKFPLEDDALRITQWSGINPKALMVARSRELYLGEAGRIGRYTGYQDNGASYNLTIQTGWTPFSENTAYRLKFLKYINLYAEVGSAYTPSLTWFFDYAGTGFSGAGDAYEVTTGAEWGLAEYNVDEFATSAFASVSSVPGLGSGTVMNLFINVTINGGSHALERIDLRARVGRSN